MASVFDILGTVLSVLSLLGCFRSVYRFLKNRQPFAQAKILEEALREAYKRVDELEQYGYLSEHSNLSSVYVSALARYISCSGGTVVVFRTHWLMSCTE